MKQVVLIGCGNIGFRHLQALGTMDVPSHITVVEPADAHHDRIRAQFDAAADVHRYTLLEQMPGDRTRFDLAVVATAAAQRRSAVDRLLADHELGALVLEKVLFQTVADLDEVGSALRERDIPTFVNCSRRTFAGYHELRSTSGNASIVDVDGRSLGMASNAIHFLDLLEFLSDDELVDVDLSGLDVAAQSGRRPGTVEIFGTLRATTSRGARLRLVSLDQEPVAVNVGVGIGDDRHVIDELARTLTRPDGTTEPFAGRNVSEAGDVLQAALESGSCVLTSYADSARQHRLFISALRSHLGLSNERDEPCPIS